MERPKESQCLQKEKDRFRVEGSHENWDNRDTGTTSVRTGVGTEGRGPKESRILGS